MATPTAVCELKNDEELTPFVLEGKLTGNQLGDGLYGSVEEIEIRSRRYAGKRIDEHLITANGVTVEKIGQKLTQECQLMSTLRHKNLAAFVGVCFIPQYGLPLLVTELLDGSLDDLLETIPSIPLPLKRSILEDVACALLYLHRHQPPIVHRDLTAKNVLLTTSLEAKISDFRNYHIVNTQPDFSSAIATQVYLPHDVISDASVSGPSTDVFSCGHLILFTLTQEFPNDLLEVNYTDPNTHKESRHSEVDRRKKYFDMLEDMIVKGPNHPLAQLAKDCLDDNPTQRPTAEQLVTALKKMEDEVEGAYGEFSKLDAVRQVIAMKEQFAKEFELKEKNSELIRKNEKIKQLQKKVETAKETVKEERIVVEQKVKDEIKLRDNQIEKFQETVLQLKKELLEKEKEYLHWDSERQQKESKLQQTKKEVRRKEDKIKQRDAVIDEKDTQLIKMDEELKKLQETLELKVAELNQKDSTINHRENDVDQIEVKLQQKDNQLLQKEKEIQLRKEEIELKDVLLLKKDGELKSMMEHFTQLKAEIERLKMELKERDNKINDSQNEKKGLLEEIQEKVTDLKINHSELEEKQLELQKTLTALKCKDEELQKKCEELETKESELKQRDDELERKEREVQQKDNELEGKEKELQSKTGELQEVNKTLHQKANELEEEDKELLSQVKEYKKKLRELNKILEEKDSNIKQLTDEVCEKKSKVEKNKEIIEKTREELQSRKEELKQLATQLQEKNNELEEMNKDIKQKSLEINALQQQLQKEADIHREVSKTKDSQISTIMEHIYQLQEAQEGLRTDLDHRNADVSRLQEELEQLKERPYMSAMTHHRDLLNIELPLKLHWRRGKDIPEGHGMRFHPQAIVIGGKIYLGGGKSEKSKQVMVYEPKHEVWATLPHYQYELFAMTVIEDQLIVVGGEESRSRKKTNVLGVWDDTLCYWTHPLPPMLTACSSPAVINYHDKWLVVAGGNGSGEGGSDLFIVEVMDICNDQWYSAPPLPIPASRMSATVIDSTMYVLGGCSGYYFFKNVFKVDIAELVTQAVAQEIKTTSSSRVTHKVPAQTPWQKLPDTPFSQSTALTLNGALLAVGGQGGSAIHLYHPESRSWVKVGDMPTERVQCASTVLPHGEVLLAGGANTEELMEFWALM